MRCWPGRVIKGRPAMLCVLDQSFMMGSMGSVVGEVVTRSSGGDGASGAGDRGVGLW